MNERKLIHVITQQQVRIEHLEMLILQMHDRRDSELIANRLRNETIDLDEFQEPGTRYIDVFHSIEEVLNQ